MNARLLTIICTAFILFTLAANAQQSNGKYNTTSENVAIGGYDLVAYFNQHDAVRGNSSHSAKHDGVTFYFSNAENKKAFQKDPQKYLPQYGGYCAFAMAAKNAKAPSDPSTFKLHDGKLYFFFNDFYEGGPFNTIVPWNADEASLIRKANANWKKMN